MLEDGFDDEEVSVGCDNECNDDGGVIEAAPALGVVERRKNGAELEDDWWGPKKHW